MSQNIISFFSFCPDWLQVFIISLFPIVELRGAIPWGTLALGMPIIKVYILAVLGNLVPAPFILILIPKIINWMRSTKLFGKLGNWIYNLGMKKSKSIVKYESWGLTLFIAVPLPGTGVWTGCLAASLIGMDFKKGIKCAIFGALIAGVIVSVLCQLGIMVL